MLTHMWHVTYVSTYMTTNIWISYVWYISQHIRNIWNICKTIWKWNTHYMLKYMDLIRTMYVTCNARICISYAEMYVAHMWNIRSTYDNAYAKYQSHTWCNICTICETYMYSYMLNTRNTYGPYITHIWIIYAAT